LAQHDTYTTTASRQRLLAAPVLLWSSLIQKPQQIEEIHEKTTRSRCQNQFTEEKNILRLDNRGLNPQSTALEASMLTIMPLMQGFFL
jgi:hypothetical protein